MGYFSYKEEEAYREGYNDGRFGRHDYFRDEHFGNDIDKAYYDGLRKAEEEHYRQMEERKMEEEYYRQMEERKIEEEQHIEPWQEYPDDLPF